MLEKFSKIIGKVSKVGFDNYHQAGTPNKYHELNIVCESEKLNRQYWITKSFGKFEVSYREGIGYNNNKTFRFPCKNQTELIKTLDEISKEISA